MSIGAKCFCSSGLLAAWLAAALYSPACAQSADDYPNHPVQVNAPLHGLLDGGKSDVIATTGRHRLSFLKDVPTVMESGVPDFVVSSWNGIAALAGVPKPIITKFSMSIIEVLRSPDAQAAGQNGSTPDELHHRLISEIAKWSDLIEKANIPKHD